MEHVIELRSVERSFVTEPDFADRVASMFGAKSNARTLRAVDEIDLTIGPGEVVGLVGESGCGKSTLGRIVAGILPQDKGDVLFNGRALADKTRLKDGSGLGVQMIFQNPASALDPRQRIGDAIAEAPVAHRLIHRSEARNFALNALQRVGLGEDALERFPHEFSGGQRQRICIARALAVDPRVVVCDEAVASLDVSIQAQIINLFLDLKQELNLSYLFISHDISVIEYVADRVAVMYLGQIVEIGAIIGISRWHQSLDITITSIDIKVVFDHEKPSFATYNLDKPVIACSTMPASACCSHTIVRAPPNDQL